MKDDLERDLRALFDERASEGATAPRVPERVVRRSRRRQGAAVAVSMVAVVALAGVSIAGLRIIDNGRSTSRMPAGDTAVRSSAVFERSATIHDLQVTSPSDWFLVNQYPLGLSLIATAEGVECAGTVAQTGVGRDESGTEGTGSEKTGTDTAGTVEPIGDVAECDLIRPDPGQSAGTVPAVQLSNRDLGLERPACGLGETDPVALSGGDAVMAVVIDDGDDVVDPTWVDGTHQVTIDASGPPVDGICGPGYYRTFAIGAFHYVAWAGFGPDVSDADRQVVLASLAAVGSERTGLAEPEDPSYVVAAGQDWNLEVRPSHSDGPGANIELTLQGEDFGGIAGDFTVPAVPIEECCDPAFGPQATVKAGAVTKDASGVELRYVDGSPSVTATIVPLPPSLAFDFDLFFAEAPDADQATAVALGVG